MSTSAEWNVYEKVKDRRDALDINYVKYKGTPSFSCEKRCECDSYTQEIS